MKKTLWRHVNVAVSLLSVLMTSLLFSESVDFKSDKYNYENCSVVIESGTTKLNHDVYTIRAASKDVNVFLGKDSSELVGHGHLRFIAEAGHTITIQVDQNLTFAGSSSDKPLLLTFGGLGTTVFEVLGGNSINFGTKDGPTKAFVIMENDGAIAGKHGQCPTLQFKRLHGKKFAAMQDIVINVGQGSTLSYLSAYKNLLFAQDTGSIVFDVGNIPASDVCSVPGSMVLVVDDKAACITAGHWVKASKKYDSILDYNTHLYKKPFSLDDIHLDVAAGHKAITKVTVNQSSSYDTFHGGLIIANHNNSFSELLSDPFYHLKTRKDTHDFKGSFKGNRYGWVLGANGILDIDHGTFVMYDCYAENCMPNSLTSLRKIEGFKGVDVRQLVKKRNPSAFIVDGNNNPEAQKARINLGKQSGLFFRSLAPSSTFSSPGSYVFAIEAPLHVNGSNTDKDQRSKIEILSAHIDMHGGDLFYGDKSAKFPQRSFEKVVFPGDDSVLGQKLVMYNKAAFFVNDSMQLHNVSLVHTDMNHKVYEKNDLQSEPTYVGGEKWLIDFVNKKNGSMSIVDNGLNSDPFGSRHENYGSSSYGGSYGYGSHEGYGSGYGLKDTFNILPDSGLLTFANDHYLLNRPHIAFYNSRFNIHSHVAITGMDLKVPTHRDNEDGINFNHTKMVFYQNSPSLNNGAGRHMVLGTLIGSFASDNVTVLSRDAHIDVFEQEEEDTSNAKKVELSLENEANTKDIFEDIESYRISSQKPAVHSLYLGHKSNISIGNHLLDGDVFELQKDVHAIMKLNGNFFSISSYGGSLSDSKTAHITGQGGVFVDAGGKFTIGKNFRATMNTMVTRSMGGKVDLPAGQVVFGDQYGIADWKLSIVEHGQRVLVDKNDHISNYTLHWLGVQHDSIDPTYVSSVYKKRKASLALPLYNVFDVPLVKAEHLSLIPVVKGEVDQFQVQGSQMGNEAQVMIDGGHVRELVFIPTSHVGEIPAAVLVLKNNARIGIGPVDDAAESLFASTTLGLDGVTIIAEGSGQVDLNQDIVVDNRAVFLKGPHFGAHGSDVLHITSTVPRVLRITSKGILDLQSFTHGSTVSFGGNIRIELEPGARILLGGGLYQFAQNAHLVAIPYNKAQEHFDYFDKGAMDNSLNPLELSAAHQRHNMYAPVISGKGLQNTDMFRVKIIGRGVMQFVDNAKFSIDKNAFVGVETLKEDDGEIAHTDLTIQLQDKALFSLGGNQSVEGGAFQVGNTQNYSNHTIRFALELDGSDTIFNIGAEGFFGLNGAIVSKGASQPNYWLVDVPYNVETVTIDVKNGTFKHANIFTGDDQQSKRNRY